MAEGVCINGYPGEKRQKMEELNKVTVVVGAQFGDEGKGKVVDMICQSADIVCRCQVRINTLSLTKQGGMPCCVVITHVR